MKRSLGTALVIDKEEAPGSLRAAEVQQKEKTPTLEGFAPTEVLISPRKCCQFLVIVVVFLTLAGSSVQRFKYALGHDYQLGLFPLFNLNSELSIPAWYASVALLLCSMLVGVVFIAKRKKADPFALHWAVLALLFLYLSVDEGAQIHETIGTTLSLTLPAINYGFLRFTWVLYGIALVIVVAASYIKFLAHLPSKTRRLFTLAALTYVGGALGMEMVNARYAGLHGSENLTYQMMSVAEEFLEMSGIVIFMYALILYIGSQVRVVRIQFSASSDK